MCPSVLASSSAHTILVYAYAGYICRCDHHTSCPFHRLLPPAALLQSLLILHRHYLLPLLQFPPLLVAALLQYPPLLVAAALLQFPPLLAAAALLHFLLFLRHRRTDHRRHLHHRRQVDMSRRHHPHLHFPLHLRHSGFFHGQGTPIHGSPFAAEPIVQLCQPLLVAWANEWRVTG